MFAATALLTLALGIGGNTAIFTVIRAVLLKPLDYPKPDQLVNISGGASPTRYEEIRVAAKSFRGVGAFVGAGAESLTLTGQAEPEVLKGARVSANFLSILGTQPIVGRNFQPSEDLPDSVPVVLISERLWSGRFQRDPHVQGRTIVLSEAPYTIVGVLPARFAFPFPVVDIWMTRPAEWPQMAASSRSLSPFLSLFGRLNPNVTLEQANAELMLIHHRYALEHPAMLDAKAKTPAELQLVKDDVVTNVRVMLWLLFGAVGFLLMITCANVASLMLARATSRSREFAARAAIGASWLQLLAQSLAESLLLSFAGGALGVVLAAASLRAIPSITSFELPRSGEIRLDWMVLLFAASLSIATGLLFGLAPALKASRPDLISALRGTGSAASTRDGFNTRSILVVAQVAFSMVLLIGAALMIETIIHLRDVNLGFNPANLMTANINLPPLRYQTAQQQAKFYADLLAKLDSTSGISNSATSMMLPMEGSAGTPVQDAAKPPLKLNERPIATLGVVSPGYFRTLQVPLRRGRDFTPQDNDGTERVAIIDEALARRFWPQYPAGLDPIGQRLFVGGVNPHPARIVGIASPVHQSLEKSAWPETVYVAFAQMPQPSAAIAVRASGSPSVIAAVVRKAVQGLDHPLPISEVHSMEYLVDAQLGQRKLVAGLLGSFSAISLLLAVIGLYGTISYSVSQRVQELAIRSALGAQQADVLRLVLGQGLLLAIVGIAVGTLGSYWLTQSLKKLLFGVSATDPATFAGVGALFALAALLASYIPARRATRVDPIDALRV